MENLVPITFFAGLFTWLILRRHYRTQQAIQTAAIARGLTTVPPVAPSDPRQLAWVLIALGLGFAIATHVSISLAPHHAMDSPLAVSIWGVVPILVGAALWAYHRRGVRPAAAEVKAELPGVELPA